MIIAEAGIWHRGDVEEAIDLVCAAAACRADAIKFQIFVPDKQLFCPLEGDDSRRRFWDESALELNEWATVRKVADREGIKFGASVFQIEAARMLGSLEPDFIKVASRAANSFPYEMFNGPFYISSGMIDSPQRQKIAHKMMSQGKEYRFLHCIPLYPTPIRKARWPGNGDGLSDHSGNPLVAIEALARGCDLIEIHFAIDKRMNRPDYAVSLMPRDLSLICEARDVFAQMRQD